MITILFYPEPLKPKPLAKVYRVLQGRDDIAYHNDPTQPYDLHMFWSYTKHSIKPDDFTLLAPNVINRGCWDIGKDKVNDVFNDIRIDPKKHRGLCVEKYDKQGKHDAHKIIRCPAKPKPDHVYQKYIDTKEGEYFIKYRVYYGDGIDYVIKNYKSRPFASARALPLVEVPKETIFTAEQELDFVRKCNKFGVDFAEIDIVMDNGVPIVVDVNNVVGGGHDPGLTGTEICDLTDETFITFIKRRYDQASKVQ